MVAWYAVRPGAEVLFVCHPVRHFPSFYWIRTAAHHIRLNLDWTHEKAHTFACSLHKKSHIKSSRIPFPWQCILPYHAHWFVPLQIFPPLFYFPPFSKPLARPPPPPPPPLGLENEDFPSFFLPRPFSYILGISRRGDFRGGETRDKSPPPPPPPFSRPRF